MKVIMAAINFYYSIDSLLKAAKEKRAVSLFAGILFAAAAGVYSYLAVKDGEIEVRFGPDAEDDEEYLD